jgi:hypothetical protein
MYPFASPGRQVTLGHSKIGAIRMSLTESEYAALRQTIATRGTVRVVLLPLTLLGWGLTATALLLFSELPVAVIFPLAMLAAGFEAIHALHVGVERIGRYVQVFYEDGADSPRWETTAMAVGPALPGGGIDPLFTVVFLSAALFNLVPALLPRPTPVELVVIGALHVVFLVRVIRARVAAARQRAVELESFRALRSKQEETKP